jgi:endonuclease YncB( thermonuclease family)
MPLLFLFLLSLSIPLTAAELAGQVVNVVSGDAIVLTTASGGRHPLRLQGIRLPVDKPVLLQAARQRLNGLIGGRFVRVDTSGLRQDGVLSGFVDWGGKEINLTLVADGLALLAPEALDARRLDIYQRQQDRARRLRLGIWHEQDGPAALPLTH